MENPSSGKASVRLRLREWLDHLLFIGYDVECTKQMDGKAKGQGTRTIYPQEARRFDDTLCGIDLDQILVRERSIDYPALPGGVLPEDQLLKFVSGDGPPPASLGQEDGNR